MATMSVTRALSELKLLDARINRAISEAEVVSFQVGKKKINGHITPEEFKNKAKSHLDSVRSLINRRNEIKSKIVESNAKTVVTFPSGKEMTVAEIIERKTSIQYDKNWLYTLRSQYNNAITKVNRLNDQSKEKLEERIKNYFGKEGTKGKEDEVELITKNFNAENEAILIDPIKVKDVIDKLTSEIEEFENEVDFLLSESNTRTDIEVSD